MKDVHSFTAQKLKRKVAFMKVMAAIIITCFIWTFYCVSTLDINRTVVHIILSLLFLLMITFILLILIYNTYKHVINSVNYIHKSIAEVAAINYSAGKKAIVEERPEPDFTDIVEIYKKFNNLKSLIENINSSNSFEDLLKYIYSTFIDFVPYSYIGIALIKDDGKSVEASFGISDGAVKGLPQNLIGEKAYIEETSLGEVIRTGRARIINDLDMYLSGKKINNYNKIILEAGIRASITLPLKLNNNPVGVIFFSSCNKNVYTEEHAVFLETLANSIAIGFDKSIFFDDVLYSSVFALARLAEARDTDTGEHLERMKKYSAVLAQLLYEDSKYMDIITPGYVNDIEKFSPLHDIGKVGVKDSILLKPARLTGEEYEEMKQHTVYGAQVLREADQYMVKRNKSLFGMGIEIAEGHHERWDGSGYPYGKSGEDIPLSARIVAVADVFDALTSKRPYKEPYSFDESFEIIMQDSGKHFDPEIVRVFKANRQRIFEVYNSFYPKML
ncbi:MAG TPA: GAF domain-containing protein [Clostridiaceae bacterium]|nr:GAF domain-containing protein [Clostridiaceae bacterium]